MSLRSQRLADAEQIPVRINDGKLSHSPRFVCEAIHPRDAVSRQPGPRKREVYTGHVGNPEVAHRRRLSGDKLTLGEKVQLHQAPTKDRVVTVTMNLALETQPLEKCQRVTQRPAGQDWNCDFVLLHNGCDV